MISQSVRLSGVSAPLLGKWWESDSLLRIGRSDSLEVVLTDSSISRQHAEVAATGQGWQVRDLGSTNGTFVNAVAVGRSPRKVAHDDILRCGQSIMAVTLVQTQSRPHQGTPHEGIAVKDPHLFLHMVSALARATSFRDVRASARLQRVTDYAMLLAQELELSPSECQCLLIGTPLHDIGTMQMGHAPRTCDKLSVAEADTIRAHALQAATIMATITELGPIMPIVRSHRERWDGQGFPDGLCGEQIPLLARIVALANAFDAMTKPRSDGPGLRLEDAFAELRKKAGAEFDPRCVQAFMRLHSRIGQLIDRSGAADQTVTILKEMAYHDALTGLPNRRLCDELFRQAIAHARRKAQLAAVLFLDLDGFKTINDSAGHATGDVLLKMLAQRLKKCVRESDIVSRLGGDEFLLVLDGVTHADGAGVVAQKILDCLAQPFQVDRHNLVITASIGISLYPADGDDVDALVHQADLAMYHAKAQGKNNYQLYQPPMNVTAHKHRPSGS